jgi:hypothetical protein
MGQRDYTGKSRHLAHALAAVEVMGGIREGVVVPKTPSASMIAAGARTGGVSKEAAARIYRVMILAGGS